MNILRLCLSERRRQMADQIAAGQQERSADFDYRRRVADDVEALLRDSGLIKHTGSVEDRHEQEVLLHRVAGDIATYIVR